MKHKEFWLGFGAGVLSLALIVACLIWKYPPYMVTHTVPVKSTPAPRPQPSTNAAPTYYTTNAWGLRIEHSTSSQQRVIAAVKEFLQRVSRSGLRCPVNGQPQITVYNSGRGAVARLRTDDTFFGVDFFGTNTLVSFMQKRGLDENGLPRNYNEIVSGPADTNYLAAWADPGEYPIQAGPNDVKPEVIALLESLDIGGTNRYLLESVRQLQVGVYRLPFYAFTFTTRKFLGQGWRSRDSVEIVVRAGGTDLKPGQAELAYFGDYGAGYRELESSSEGLKPAPAPSP